MGRTGLRCLKTKAWGQNAKWQKARAGWASHGCRPVSACGWSKGAGGKEEKTGRDGEKPGNRQRTKRGGGPRKPRLHRAKRARNARHREGRKRATRDEAVYVGRPGMLHGTATAGGRVDSSGRVEKPGTARASNSKKAVQEALPAEERGRSGEVKEKNLS